MQWKTWGSSRVVTGILGSLLSCQKGVKPPFQLQGELRISPKSLQGNWASSRIEGFGIWWFSSSCGGKLGLPLKLQCGPQGTSFVASGESGLLASCEGSLEIPLGSPEGNWASYKVETENSGFSSSCNRVLGEPLKFQKGNEAFFLVVMGNL